MKARQSEFERESYGQKKKTEHCIGGYCSPRITVHRRWILFTELLFMTYYSSRIFLYFILFYFSSSFFPYVLLFLILFYFIFFSFFSSFPYSFIILFPFLILFLILFFYYFPISNFSRISFYFFLFYFSKTLINLSL